MIITFIWNLLAFLVALGLLITLHECGHFLVARCCGVRVERFAIGFGPALWRYVDRQGTEYVLAPIPLGGYVKMLDERGGQAVAPSLRAQAFNHQPIWQRTAIIAAGPGVNFLFALLAYWWVLMAGVPVVSPVIGTVLPNSPAAQAGIVAGMHIKAVEEMETPNWEAVNLGLAARVGKASVTLRLQPAEALSGDGVEGQPVATQQRTIALQNWKVDLRRQTAFESLGITPQQSEIRPVIQSIEPQSAAACASLRVGDRILRYNEQLLGCWQQLVHQIRTHPQQPLVLTVERAGSIQNITLIPQEKRLPDGQIVGYVGISPQIVHPPSVCQRYGPLTALARAGVKTWQVSGLTLRLTGQLMSGKLGLKQLGGPIAIAKGAGSAAASGLSHYLLFLGLISINLGIVNLLPLPVLDGGHLLFLMQEALIGRPVSEKVQEVSQRIGTLLLMILMGIALFNDVMCG